MSQSANADMKSAGELSMRAHDAPQALRKMRVFALDRLQRVAGRPAAAARNHSSNPAFRPKRSLDSFFDDA